MPALIPYLLGKNVSVVLTPMIEASGYFTAYSVSYSFQGKMESDSYSHEYRIDEHTPLNCNIANPVIRDYSARYQLTEILVAQAPPTSTGYYPRKGFSLEEAFLQSPYQKVDITMYTRFTYQSFRTYSFYAIMNKLDRQSNKGKNTMTAELTLMPMPNGSGGWSDSPIIT